MRFILLLLFVLFNRLALCQDTVFKDEEYYSKLIDKNIGRGTLTLQPGFELTASLCYERELRRPFTFVLKAGPAVFTNPGSGDGVLEFSLIASGELRWYFNLLKRIKHEKATRNFSAAYLSLEPFVRSNALLVFKRTGYEGRPVMPGVYLNIGAQKQVKRTYFALYCGIRFIGDPNSYEEVMDVIHAGLVFGRVF